MRSESSSVFQCIWRTGKFHMKLQIQVGEGRMIGFFLGVVPYGILSETSIWYMAVLTGLSASLKQFKLFPSKSSQLWRSAPSSSFLTPIHIPATHCLLATRFLCPSPALGPISPLLSVVTWKSEKKEAGKIPTFHQHAAEAIHIFLQ